MTDTDHVDRFRAAVKVLAGHGHIKQRLIDAFANNLDEIDVDELPVSVRQAFADLKQLMHRVAPQNGEGAVCASVRKMSVSEAGEYAVSVVSMYDDIMRLGSPAPVAVPLPADDAPRIPPFLVKSLQ